MKTARGGWEGRSSQHEREHKRVPNPYNSFTTSQAPLRKAKITSFIENAMAGARQAGLGVRFSTAHNKSWHHISKGLFPQERIKQSSPTFPASLLLFSTPIPVQICYCDHSAQSFSSLGQVWPALSLPCVPEWSDLGVCRVLTPSAGCVGLCPSPLLREVMLLLLPLALLSSAANL